ncbi:MAG: TonB-dependent receptor [Elusimicrobia bacterium]|nr:TonB-dependent receptor [Elusimicrobiota bacterium]
MRYARSPLCLAFAAAAVLGAAARAQPPAMDQLLSYDLSELMKVEVVTASKERQPASEAPATVRVITAEQIQERGYQTLEEALASLPGFQFRDISGFNSYVFLRGLPNQNNLILVLIDGVQINELNSGGFYAGAQYNLANVKRIEVLYGPASALYGTNAISGVVNIITNDPQDIQGAGARALGGTFNTRAIDLRYGYQDEAGRYGVSFAGLLRDTDKADLRGTKGDNNWSSSMKNFEKDGSFDGKLAYKGLTLGVVVQDKQSSMATNEKTTGSTLLDSDTNWHIRFVNTYIKYLYNRDPSWSLDSRLYYRNSTVLRDTVIMIHNTAGPTGGQLGQYRPNDLVGLENRLSWKPRERLELIAGAVVEYESLAESLSGAYSGDPLVRPPAPPTPKMLSNELLSLYAQGRYELLAGLQLHGGVRYDNSSYYGNVATPRAALVYNQDKLTLKLLYGEGFRAPRPWDRTYGSGNLDLKPEKMRSGELSGTYALTGNLMADLSLYQNKLDGLLTLDTVNNRYVNTGDIQTRGLEARVEFAQGRFKSYLNYAYQDSQGSGISVAEISRNTAGAGALYAFGKHVKLDLCGRYLGPRKNPKVISASGKDSVDGTVVADATLSLVELRNVDVRFIVKNLFDQYYYHTSNRDPERYRQASRQLLVQLGYSFGFPNRAK